MPVEPITLYLRPRNFFLRNAALDVPPSYSITPSEKAAAVAKEGKGANGMNGTNGTNGGAALNGAANGAVNGAAVDSKSRLVNG